MSHICSTAIHLHWVIWLSSKWLAGNDESKVNTAPTSEPQPSVFWESHKGFHRSVVSGSVFSLNRRFVKLSLSLLLMIIIIASGALQTDDKLLISLFNVDWTHVFLNPESVFECFSMLNTKNKIAKIIIINIVIIRINMSKGVSLGFTGLLSLAKHSRLILWTHATSFNMGFI